MVGAERLVSASLSTLDLCPADTTLVQSLLRLFDGRTRVQWRHVSDEYADVVICMHDSPLAYRVQARERVEGTPLCIALSDRGGPLPRHWSRVLHRPIRMRELFDALEAVATELVVADARDVATGPVHTTMMQAGTDELDSAAAALHDAGDEPTFSTTAPTGLDQSISLVGVLRDLKSQSGHEDRVLRVQADNLELLAHLPRGRCYSPQGFGIEVLDALSSPHHRVSVEPCAQASTDDASPAGDWIWLDTLLWRIGLQGGGTCTLGRDPSKARYRLNCWPDLGKIPSNLLHIRLTALFTKRATRIDEAARLLNTDWDKVRDFLRACGCCGLLQMLQPDSTVPVMSAHVLQHRRFGLFDRLRAGLGMRH